MSRFKTTNKEWDRFIKSIDLSLDDPFHEGFDKLSKKYGVAYLSYLEASYEAKDQLSDEEFCNINGKVPIEFVIKYLKYE